MTKVNIELLKSELMTLLQCIESAKREEKSHIEEYKRGLETGYFKDNFKEGHEDFFKGRLEEREATIREFENLKDDLITRFVAGEIEKQ